MSVVPEAPIDPALVPQRTLRSGRAIPAIGMGTFGSDTRDPQARPFGPSSYLATWRALQHELRSADRKSRLIKGQVFLWPGATSWLDLCDADGTIPGWTGYGSPAL